ncbi:MAG: prepilin-type N-terminal cleavage/methylation domain-containing protein [Puniceicoccales bacterium]|jgi:prepilin-type N-terminal cleavage/methylation domain-containing protein|nr:prepilin-type N-terminal cleavage/methylation domain-containing protein [Puniceicoccales bacterium]
MKIVKKLGFTLIELIIVVSIIAILMSIIIPASQKVFAEARKSKARAAMKQIAETYCRYYQNNGFIPYADSSLELAERFAEEGELNNANLFVFPGDSQAAAVMRENIWPIDEEGEYKHAWEPDKKLSVVLVGNITKEVNQSTTPIAYSRGLDKENGTWSKDGVWGTDGGFIGFLDGQVRWFKTIDNKLSTENGETSSIEAILGEDGVGGRILDNVDTYYW